MIALFRRYRYFYLTAFILIVLGLIIQLFTEKGELVLALNALHNEFLDSVFMIITKMGELAGGIIVFLLLLIFGSKKYVLAFVLSIVVTTGASQGLKHTIFKQERRPIVAFENLKPVDSLERHRTNSFPSGHTTASFTFMTLLAIGLKKNWIQIGAPVLGALIGLSRVYLGQHYLNDIIAGAILGLLLTSMVLMFIENRFKEE
ncbi:MAG: phosphatase PAP2 family protein [Bacteroidia bacterium]